MRECVCELSLSRLLIWTDPKSSEKPFLITNAIRHSRFQCQGTKLFLDDIF